jgi:tripartite-type tricarboxylate transporter receptor subunit TctC
VRPLKTRADGYTLLVVNDANAYSATLYDNLKFNFIHDITPVASIGRVAFVMVVNPSFAAKTVPEFIAKANPGKINMATLGPGSPSQLPHNCALPVYLSAEMWVLRRQSRAAAAIVGGS